MPENPRWVGIGSKFAHLTAAHPCFGEKAHFKVARIHLPVAPRCNIQCNFCIRKIDKCEYRPGVAASIIGHEDAVRRVEAMLRSDPNLKVVGIAGPGDPLENEETYKTLAAIHERWPDLIMCIATNGLLAAERAEELARLGVRTATITINAIDPAAGAKIYDWVRYKGKLYRGEEAARLLIEKQLDGIEALVANGIVVRVNMVLIPEVNLEEAPKIAEAAAKRGASLMNIIPLIPLHRFAGARGPTCEELNAARYAAEQYIPQFRLCKQCRADACGVPGLERGEPGKTEYFHG